MVGLPRIRIKLVRLSTGLHQKTSNKFAVFLVQKRETFLNDEYVRRNFVTRGNNSFVPRRQVAEIDLDAEFEGAKIFPETELSVNALERTSQPSACWNCDNVGHHWQDCLDDRQIFCYGCGTKKTYKPNCAKCNTRKPSSKNFMTFVPQQEQQ